MRESRKRETRGDGRQRAKVDEDVCCHGNSQSGQLSHVAEGVRGQCADAVVAQVSACAQTNTQ